MRERCFPPWITLSLPPIGGGCEGFGEPISLAVRDENLDRRLLGHFEQSWERQEQARRILPAKWLADERPVAQQLNELFLDLIERAHLRVSEEREAAALRRVRVVDARD